jgi:hypothetical protein
LMVASWSISEEKHPQKKTGDRGSWIMTLLNTHPHMYICTYVILCFVSERRNCSIVSQIQFVSQNITIGT